MPDSTLVSKPNEYHFVPCKPASNWFIALLASNSAVAFSASANPNFKGLWGVQNKVNEQRDRTDFEEQMKVLKEKINNVEEKFNEII